MSGSRVFNNSTRKRVLNKLKTIYADQVSQGDPDLQADQVFEVALVAVNNGSKMIFI